MKNLLTHSAEENLKVTKVLELQFPKICSVYPKRLSCTTGGNKDPWGRGLYPGSTGKTSK